jgi:myo-inositol-hexaphosphate 3-phosphohydrolase
MLSHGCEILTRSHDILSCVREILTRDLDILTHGHEILTRGHEIVVVTTVCHSDSITSTVRLFVDNTIAYLTIESNRDCTTLQNDLDKLSIWEQKWKMAFHPDKCNVLSITRNKTPVKHAYTLHGHQLEHADKVQYLGVTIQSDLKWDSHINNITTKANKTLGFLRRNINISSTKVKEQAYKILNSTITRMCLFCIGPIYQRRHNPIRTGTT